MKKEVNCINTRAVLDYVEKHNNGDYSSLLDNLDPEIDRLPDPAAFLRDPNNWISCMVNSKLFERARLLLHDEMAAHKIARYAVEKTSLGYVQRIFVKAFWSYKIALKHAQKVNDKWNRSKRVELRKIEKNEAVVRLHWDPLMDITKDNCLMNQGVYTYMPLIWGGEPLSFHEESCYFEGAPYCEYHLKWPSRNRVHEIFSRFFKSKSVLRETIREMEADKKVIKEKYEEVNRLNKELNQKIKQHLAIQETGKAILSILDLGQLLTVIMNLLYSVCKINRAIIMMVNEEKKNLEYLHGVGFGNEIPEEVRNYKIPLTRVRNILARVANTGRSEYVPEVENSDLRKENILITKGRPVSVYVVPLITKSRVVGILATDAAEGEAVPEETRDTLEIFAPQIAIAIENARLYSSLQDKMRELERSHVLLSRAEKFSFLGNLAARLAHEIKNPMTSIGTFIQMLPDKYDDEEFRNGFHQIAMEETARVNNLITELLDLVKERDSHFALTDLHGLIDKMILLVSPQSKSKKVKVVRQFDPSIEQAWMDAEKIKQVVLNLLSNAIEYTPDGGKVEIITRNCTERVGEKWIQIVFRDNGQGIAEEIQEKIFEPYFTTKHKSSLHNGTGLGLFISHTNIEAHGGTIEVKSEINRGTTFIVTVPSGAPKEKMGERKMLHEA